MAKKKRRVPIWAEQPADPAVPVKRRTVLGKHAVIILASGSLVAGAIAVLRRVDWRTLADLAEKLRSPLLPLLFFVAIVVILLLWKLPVLQVARSRALTDEKRFDRENEARKTLAQVLAGVFVLAGLYSSVQTFDLSRQGQITDRFTKAIEQLGAVESAAAVDTNGRPKPKLEVRLGAIYALERIADDSERDHWPIMEVLTAYIRENSPAKGRSKQTTLPETSADPPPRLRIDIQAILDVINRRNLNYDPPGRHLDLSGSDLSGAHLYRSHLNFADLSNADLVGANLRYADFVGAIFDGAHLVGAYLVAANFRAANFSGADLRRAYLSGANLREANLSEANLGGADLRSTDLRDANFRGADLRDANLSEAINLTQGQLDSARR
jgi:hypothetical protein